MQTEINHHWFFNQSPEEVWKFLTEKELLAQWLMPNDFEPLAEHQFQFRTNPIPSLNLDGIMYCKVLEIIPYKKLAYTWNAGSGNGSATLNTFVEWTLKPKEKGTELQLVHSGFNDENFSIFSGMTTGWLKNIQKMVVLLDTSKNFHSNA